MKCLYTVWETKTCLNGYEQEVRNIMVMEQLDRFKTFIDTEIFNAYFDTEAPFWTWTSP